MKLPAKLLVEEMAVLPAKTMPFSKLTAVLVPLARAGAPEPLFQLAEVVLAAVLQLSLVVEVIWVKLLLLVERASSVTEVPV